MTLGLLKIHRPSFGVGVGVAIALAIIFFTYRQNINKTTTSDIASQNTQNIQNTCQL